MRETEALQERDEYIETLLRKIDELNGELFVVKRDNKRLRERKKPQHYKNGKRGMRYNG